MFVILIQYRNSDARINAVKHQHKSFLKEQTKQGNIITSGPRTPNTGEVIISCLQDIESLHALLNQDPFYKKRIGQYQIIEFSPDNNCEQIEDLLTFYDEKD